MANETTADVGAMATAAGQVAAAIEKVGAVRGGVQSTVADSAAGWQTEASLKFRQAMDEWDKDFQKIIDGLNRIHEALGTTRTGYQSSQEAEAASLDPIVSALNP